jgi:hypothetical protein
VAVVDERVQLPGVGHLRSSMKIKCSDAAFAYSSPRSCVVRALSSRSRLVKICKLQEGREVIHCRVASSPYSPLPFCGDRGRQLRIGGWRGELMEWTRILAYKSQAPLLKKVKKKKVGLSARQLNNRQRNIRRRSFSSIDFPHTAIKVVEMLTQLLEREAQHKDAFDCVHWQMACSSRRTRRTCRRIRPEPLRAHRVAMDCPGWPALLRSVVDVFVMRANSGSNGARSVSGSDAVALRPIMTRSWRSRNSVRKSGPRSESATRNRIRSCLASAAMPSNLAKV